MSEPFRKAIEFPSSNGLNGERIELQVARERSLDGSHLTASGVGPAMKNAERALLPTQPSPGLMLAVRML
jgi:hypothetical protein